MNKNIYFNPNSVRLALGATNSSRLSTCRVLAILVLISGGCLFGPAPVKGATMDAYSYQAIAGDLLHRGMYLEALGMFAESARIADDPEDKAWAWLQMGATLSLFLEQYEEALGHFENVLRNYPQSRAAPEALFNAGTVFYETGDFKRAQAIFADYLLKYPRGARAQSARFWQDSAAEQMAAPEVEKRVYPQKRIVDTSIRVLIKENVAGVWIGSGQGLTVSDMFGENTIFQGQGPLAVSRQDNALKIGSLSTLYHLCRISGGQGSTLAVEGRQYRGDLVISLNSRGLNVVNYLPLEEYLYGVLPMEMPHTWDQEALRAQAVAARTYALFVKGKNADKAYDLKATTESQVYGGAGAEKAAASAAVDATRGLVMTHGGRLIVAYFHADSGGYTEDAKNVWGADIPYLKGVPDRFSTNASGNSWAIYFSYLDLEKRLNLNGLDVGPIRALQVSGNSPSGRTLGIKVLSDQGTYVINSNRFRRTLGENRLKSTLFNLIPQGAGILVQGSGYGHGVGMSQWGAHHMARAGFDFKDILKHYYRDIDIMALGGF